MPQPLAPFFFQPIIGEHFREQRFHSRACLVRCSSDSACFLALCHDLNVILCRGDAYKEIPDIVSANLDLIDAGLCHPVDNLD